MELTAEVGDTGRRSIPSGSIMVLLNDQDSFGEVFTLHYIVIKIIIKLVKSLSPIYGIL